MQPVVEIEGLLAAAVDRIVEVWVREKDGKKSDELELTLDDRNFDIPIPKSAATLKVKIGYDRTGTVPKGTYKVDSMRITAAPYEVKITAKAVDVHGKLKELQHRAYKDRTVKEIVEDIAGRNNLRATVSAGIASHRIDFEAQTGESALHFLNRLSTRYDALFKVADGRLLFLEKGELTSATGKQLGSLIVTFGNLIDYSCEVAARPRHGRGGSSTTWDRTAGIPVAIGESAAGDSSTGGGSTAGGSSGGSTGGSSPTARSRYATSSRSEGRRRARGRGNSSRRARGKMSVTIIGNPNVTVESPVVVVGVRKGLDGVWRAKDVTHHISGKSVFTTKISCEKPNRDRTATSRSATGPGIPVAIPDAP